MAAAERGTDERNAGKLFGTAAASLTSELLTNAKTLSSTATSWAGAARTGLQEAYSIAKSSAEDVSYAASDVLHKAQDLALDATDASGVLDRAKSAKSSSVASLNQVRQQSAAQNSRSALWKAGFITDALQ